MMQFRKAFTIYLIILFQLMSLSNNAQQLSDEWRLTKISKTESGSNPVTTEYAYDNAGRLTIIKYFYNNNFGNKWDGSAVKDILYDKQGRIISFTKYDITGNLHYACAYDNLNRIIKKQIYKVGQNSKPETKKLFQTLNYSYRGKEIIESRKVPTSEDVVDETTYTFNEKGNIIGQQRKDMSTKNVVKFVTGKFDDKPNPLIFTASYFNTSVDSKHNSTEGYWEDMKAPEKTVSTYDANGMVKKTVITERVENNTITTEYTYTYTKIKYPATAVVK